MDEIAFCLQGRKSSNINVSRDESLGSGEGESVDDGDESVEARDKVLQSCYDAQ